MSLRLQVLKGAATIGTGQALGHLLSFVRNIIVARLLGPADFGIAATFALTLSLFEMISDLGADKFLIQSRDGDDPRLQATAHLWQLAREVLAAVLILAFAWPLSVLFGVPQAFWDFCCLALVPLLRGFLHLDLKRLQRDLVFRPQVVSELSSQVLAVALAWPLAWWLRDYSAMLWIIVAQSAVFALTSHLLARRPYRLAFDRAHLHALVAFGWPLLVNGLLMFGTVQGDRALIGAVYSMRDLGLYAAAFAVSLAPVQMLVSLASGIYLPLLARVQSTPAEFARRYAVCAAMLALFAGLLAVGFVLAGPQALQLVFGAAYADAGLCLMLLAGAQSIRLLRVTTTIAAMARGDTANSMWSNAWRLVGLAAAGLAALLGASLAGVALAALFGESLAFVYSLARLARRHSVPAALCLRPAFAALCAVVLAAWVRGALAPDNLLPAALWTCALLLLCACFVLLASQPLRIELVRALRVRPVAAPLAD